MIILHNATFDWSRQSRDMTNKMSRSRGINISFFIHVFENLVKFNSKGMKTPI